MKLNSFDNDLAVDLSKVEAIDEVGKGSKGSDRRGIRTSISIIYAHLMKYCYISENKSVFGTKVSSWIASVYNQSVCLSEITNDSHWGEALSRDFNKIQKDAVDDFIAGNPEYDTVQGRKEVNDMFCYLDKYFHKDIRGYFTNLPKLKAFLDATAQINEQPVKADELNRKSQFATVRMDENYHYLILTRWPRTIWY